MSDNIDDLQLYHDLTNQIADLKRRLVNSSNRFGRAKKALKLERIRGARGTKAKLLIELKFGGHLNWTLEQIAKECFLCNGTIMDYVSQFKKSQSQGE